MSDDDAAKLMNYARREQPAALQQTVAQKPWLVKAMGNPVVMGALAVAAAKLLGSMRKNAERFSVRAADQRQGEPQKPMGLFNNLMSKIFGASASTASSATSQPAQSQSSPPPAAASGTSG